MNSDLWRRIGLVLDRVHDTDPAHAAEVLARACASEGLRPEQVEPYLAAERDATGTPDQIDPALLAAAVHTLAEDDGNPTLQAGEQLGHYQIVEPLGAGGMGEVYKARDTRLGRNVAVKILRSHLAAQAEGRARFDREARAISGLNHPHICTLHDVGRHHTIDFLVMELVEGETLAERLRRGPIPIADVLRYAIQMAEALAAAHGAGITHRDLKPANVMLTAHGVKLLDFGVAALRPQGDVLGTMGAGPVTAEGTIVGTLNYMAPEQLQGQPVDGRADLYALGVIVYEMLTGRRAFDATSPAGVVAAVLERDPEPLAAFRPDVPRALERAVSRCLARTPEQRWQSAADLAAHLQTIDPSATGTLGAPVTDSRSTGRTTSHRAIYWILAGVGAAALGLLAYVKLSPESNAPRATYRFALPPPDGTRYERVISISPDGRRIAFSAIDARDARMLWVRALDAVASQQIDGTHGALYPFWSPDGREIGFFADNKLKRVDLATGRVQIICATGLGGGATWNADGTILFAANATVSPTRLLRVSASGGPVAPVTQSPELGIHTWPHFLPDGRHYLHLRIESKRDRAGMFVGQLDTDEPKPLITAPLKDLRGERIEAENSRAVYADNYVFFLRNRALLAQPFDPVGLTLSGEPSRIVDLVEQDAPGRSSFDVSSTGVLAYIGPAARDLVQLAWFNDRGHEIGRLGDAGPYRTFAISPDGRAILADREDDVANDRRSVVRFDANSGTPTPVRRAGTYPVWSPDGLSFVHRGGAGRPVLRLTKTDGSDPQGKGLGVQLNAFPVDWSRDGRFVVGTAIRFETASRDLFVLEVASGALTFPVASNFEEADPKLSPDGQWLAYAAADELNRWEVYVRPFQRTGGVWRVSRGGGRFPRWADDGRSLLYVKPDGTLARATLDARGSAINVTAIADLFHHDALTYEYNLPSPTYPYDNTGNRFLVRLSVRRAAPEPINVIVNWQALVKPK